MDEEVAYSSNANAKQQGTTSGEMAEYSNANGTKQQAPQCRQFGSCDGVGEAEVEGAGSLDARTLEREARGAGEEEHASGGEEGACGGETPQWMERRQMTRKSRSTSGVSAKGVTRNADADRRAARSAAHTRSVHRIVSAQCNARIQCIARLLNELGGMIIYSDTPTD